MTSSFYRIPGSITAPSGFLAAGVFCDIKRLGTGKGSDKGAKRDLGLIVSKVPAQAAAMFTTNQVVAAPVKASLRRNGQQSCRAIVVNSGNANACTGPAGTEDAEAMAALTARELKIAPLEVLVCSTGRIGVRLPMANIRRGIKQAGALLATSQQAGHDLAEAILTSDTRTKEIAVELSLAGRLARIGGVCKGAGMIQPGLSATGRRPASGHATMLAFMTSDAAIDKPVLSLALQEAVAESFNRITVDGDMSTNDTVIVLANGLAGNRAMVRPAGRDYRAFQSALSFVALELAQMIVKDGEGASRFVTVEVLGAASRQEAEWAARAVANSSLVKTSWCGGDPNWGRILDALGYSHARVKEERIDLGYGADGGAVLWALRRGQPTRVSFSDLKRVVAQQSFRLEINLNLGSGRARIYAADLTPEYVEFNKGE